MNVYKSDFHFVYDTDSITTGRAVAMMNPVFI